MRNNIYLVCPLSARKQKCNMRLTGVAFRGDSPKFDTDRMLTLFKVRNRVAVHDNESRESSMRTPIMQNWGGVQRERAEREAAGHIGL